MTWSVLLAIYAVVAFLYMEYLYRSPSVRSWQGMVCGFCWPLILVVRVGSAVGDLARRLP